MDVAVAGSCGHTKKTSTNIRKKRGNCIEGHYLVEQLCDHRFLIFRCWGDVYWTRYNLYSFAKYSKSFESRDMLNSEKSIELYCSETNPA